MATAENPGWNALLTAVAGATNAPLVDDYNDSVNAVGTAPSQWFIRPTPDATPGFFGTRDWAQPAFLPESVVDANGNGVGGRKLRVISRATATKVMISPSNRGARRATGVQYFLDGNRNTVLTAVARNKVVLCAGSIANPQLLQLSGVGPTALLTSLGIPVVVDNPNVGANMQNHYGVTGLIPRGSNPDPLLDPVGFRAPQAFVDLSGSEAVSPAQHATGQAKDGVRRAQVYVFPAAGVLPRSLVTALGAHDTPSISLMGYLVVPNRLGTVQIASTDPLMQPDIAFAYYKDVGGTTDLDRAVQMFKVFWNIAILYAGSPPIYPPPPHYPAPFGPAPDDALLRDDAKSASTLAAFHASGTCRMAPDATTGVVDKNLDVFGVENLACCDDSVLPTITTGNTGFPPFIVAMRKAQIEGAIVS